MSESTTVTGSFERHSLSLVRIATRPTRQAILRSNGPSATMPIERPKAADLRVVWARSQDEVRLAQRLRYEVFVNEMGANLDHLCPHQTQGLDQDEFDDYCEHLLVKDMANGKVVGTYRLLPPLQAKRLGGTYTETLFDMTRLRQLRSRTVELGRSCVHPDYRSGGTIMLLAGAIFKFMVDNHFDIMVGCASIPMHSAGARSGDVAASVWQQVSKSHMATPGHQVYPRQPLPLDRLNGTLAVEPPALISAYLRMGAKVLGPPAWDPVFNTADLPIMARLDELPARYRKHFVGA